MLILCVGNGFIRSTPHIVSNRLDKWENIDNLFPKMPRNELRLSSNLSERMNPFPTQTPESVPFNEQRNPHTWAAGDSHKPYGVDGLFPVQRTAVIIEPFGTDKSVPYAKHNISRFNEPR